MKIVSSMIDEVEWREQASGLGYLFVLFKSEDAYVYKRVPLGIYEKLLCAESAGTFLNTYVKGPNPEMDPIYDYEKLDWNKRSEYDKPSKDEREPKISLHDVIAARCYELQEEAKCIEDFTGQRKEYLRNVAVQLAVEVADSILLKMNEGNREELDLMTAEVAHRFCDKVVMAARSIVTAKEINDRISRTSTSSH